MVMSSNDTDHVEPGSATCDLFGLMTSLVAIDFGDGLVHGEINDVDIDRLEAELAKRKGHALQGL